MSVVEIKHRDAATKFLIKNGGDNPENGVSIDALAQLLADTEDATGKQFTKFWIEKQDKWQEQTDALYAFISPRGSMFSYDIEHKITELIKAFRVMEQTIKDCETRARLRESSK